MSVELDRLSLVMKFDQERADWRARVAALEAETHQLQEHHDCEWCRGVEFDNKRLEAEVARLEAENAQLVKQLNGWRELGEEMQRIAEFMTPVQREDLLPDWFLPRLEQAVVAPPPPPGDQA